MKDLKVKLGGHDTKEVILPTYRDDGRDEILLILVKEFNIISEDEDLFKEQDIGEEGDRHNLSALKKRHKLKNIKETFRKFRACLKENSRDMWIKLIEDQPVLLQTTTKLITLTESRPFSKIKEVYHLNH